MKEKLNMCGSKSVKFNIFVYVFICLIIIGMIFFVINALLKNASEQIGYIERFDKTENGDFLLYFTAKYGIVVVKRI